MYLSSYELGVTATTDERTRGQEQQECAAYGRTFGEGKGSTQRKATPSTRDKSNRHGLGTTRKCQFLVGRLGQESTSQSVGGTADGSLARNRLGQEGSGVKAKSLRYAMTMTSSAWKHSDWPGGLRRCEAVPRFFSTHPPRPSVPTVNHTHARKLTFG